MIGAIIAEFWPQIGAAILTVFTGLGIYLKGRSDSKTKNKLEDANAYIETSERIDNVDLSGDDAEWLRERSKK